MGKRSRLVAMRRKRKQALEKLIRMLAERDRLTLDLCRMAAEFADRRAFEGSRFASAVEWISENCHMTEGEAADSIAIGRRMLARSP